MRYLFSIRTIVAVIMAIGCTVVLHAPAVHAAGPTYSVSGGTITIKDTAYGTATIDKGKYISKMLSCKPNSGTKVQVVIAKDVSDAIAKGERPDPITYSVNPDSPTAGSDCRKGGSAAYLASSVDGKVEEARKDGAAKVLLQKAPDLKEKEEYRGAIKGADVDVAVSECVSGARSRASQADSLARQGGQPAKSDDEMKTLRYSYFASCYAAKGGTGDDGAENILKYLNSVSPEEDLILAASVAGGEAADDAQKELDKAAEEDKSCGSEIEGIGWIVCPLIGSITGLNDGMWAIIEALLTTDPLEQDSNDPYYSLWSTLRNIANALLVAAFIVIVYAQLTNIGISNYGVKKMLPRLIILAIAINLSYLIVSIAVDIFNMLGSTLRAMIEHEYAKMPKADAFSWEGLSGIILTSTAFTAGTAVAVAIVGGTTTMFLLLLPSALIGLLGFLAALVTLMFRQAVIPLLAIMAPLAFVAYLFPNTESVFTRWRKMFISMLLLYPMAAVLFSGMKLAGMTIAMGGGQGEGKVFALMTGLLVMAAPLFMVPFLASKSGAMIGALNGKLQGWGNKLRKPMGKWSEGKAGLSRAKYDSQGLRYRTKKDGSKGGVYLRDRLRGMRRGSQYRKRRDEVLANAYEKQASANFSDEFATRSGGVVDDMSGSPVAQAYVRAAGTAGATMKSQAAEEEVKQLVTEFKSAYGSTGLGAAKDEMIKAVTAGDVARARAMQQYLMGAGSAGALHLNEVYSDTDVTNSLAAPGAQGKDLYDSLGADALGGSIKNKSAAIDKYFTQNREGANFRSFSTLKDDASTYNALSGSSLATQADLDHLVTENKITPDSARAILDSTTVSEVGVATRAKLENKATKRKPQEVVVVGGGAGQGTSSTGAP